MELIPMFLHEMEQEAVTTRKFLSRVPVDKLDWQPHPRSMTLMQLTTHIAELPSWVQLALTTDELDFATAPYQPTVVSSADELLAILENRCMPNGQHLKRRRKTCSPTSGPSAMATQSIAPRRSKK